MLSPVRMMILLIGKLLRKMRNIRGFTLVEIILVVLLLVVTVGVVVPRITAQFFDYQLYNTVNSLEKMFSFAEKKAFYDGVFCRVRVDRLSKSFFLEEKSYRDKDAEFKTVLDNFKTVIVLPDDLEIFFSTKDAFVFFPDGTSTSGSFTLKYKDEKKVEIRIDEYMNGFKIAYDAR